MKLTLDDVAAMQFLDPWYRAVPGLEGELRNEVSEGHPLYGRKAISVARRQDSDDALGMGDAAHWRPGIGAPHPANEPRPYQIYTTLPVIPLPRPEPPPSHHDHPDRTRPPVAGTGGRDHP